MQRTLSVRSQTRRPAKTFLLSMMVLLAISVHGGQTAAQIVDSTEDVDTAGLQVEAVVGWDGVILQDGPIPISFLLTNHSERVIEGRLTLRDPQFGREVHLGEVYLGPQSTRRMSAIQDFTDWFDCFAVLSDDRQTFWQRELPLASGRGLADGGRYVLMIDKDGRKLLAKNSDGQPAATDDRPSENRRANVVELSIPSWQLPHHPGPLAMAAGIVFPENAADDLNRLQWRAIAEWVCRGGTVFLHDQSSELVRQLTEALPLPPQSASSINGMAVRLSGLGAICEYSQPLGNADGDSVRQQINNRVAAISHADVWEVAESAWFDGTPGSRADLSRALIIVVFVGYTLFSSVGALLMFRASRRRVVFYTLMIVLGSSAMAGMVGVYLRQSDGDLSWVTVTQPGVGGAVQYARIDVQSAGGRNSKVAVAGGGRGSGWHPDLQCSHRPPRQLWGWYLDDRDESHHPPFTWQPNLLTGSQNNNPRDACQIDVPITPWGQRRCYATAFQSNIPELEFELALTPTPGSSNMKDNLPSGVFGFKLTNHLNQDLTAVWLMMATTAQNVTSDDSVQSNDFVVNRSGQWIRRNRPDKDERTVVFQLKALQPVASGATAKAEFAADFISLVNWERVCRIPAGQFTAPLLQHSDSSKIWLVAQVSNSPILKIEESLGDFIPREELHLIIQELRPENLTDEANQLRFSGQ